VEANFCYANVLWRPAREKDYISLQSEGAGSNQDCISLDC
jgi:hypothetical protein